MTRTGRPPAQAPEGALLVDKPVGPTSHAVVARARKALGIRRIGHTGTLDPFASGLLILLVGRSTRLAEYLADPPKEYRARARLGVRTETDDPEGRVLDESDAWRGLAAADVTAAFEALVGEIDQVPPVYSAKKLEGEAAYRRARRGDVVTLAPVRVRIHELVVEEVALPEVAFRVVCSTGTYVRALARDAGEDLGVGASLTALRRTRIGAFTVDEAVSADRLDDAPTVERARRDPLRMLSHLSRVDVDEEQARRLAAGQAVEVPGAQGGLPDRRPLAVAHRGRLVAVAEREGDRLRPRKVFVDG